MVPQLNIMETYMHKTIGVELKITMQLSPKKETILVSSFKVYNYTRSTLCTETRDIEIRSIVLFFINTVNRKHSTSGTI